MNMGAMWAALAKRDSIKQLLQLGLVLMMGISMSACSKTSWKEEVLLHDGSKVIVDRTVTRGGRHEIGQQPPVEEEGLSVTLPGNNRHIKWRSEFSKEIGSAELAPLLFDIHQDTAYLVSVPVGCLSFNKWARPNPPYVIFKHDGKNWLRIPLQELPSGIKTPNLIFSSPDNEIERLGTKFVSAEMIKEIFERYTQPEYKTILREPVIKQGPEGCPEMIYDGHGGWMSRGLFTAQPTYETCIRACATEGMSEEICPCNSIFKRK